jgi:hypothetical protein
MKALNNHPAAGICTSKMSWLYPSQMARPEGTETGFSQTQAYSEKQQGN